MNYLHSYFDCKYHDQQPILIHPPGQVLVVQLTVSQDRLTCKVDTSLIIRQTSILLWAGSSQISLFLFACNPTLYKVDTSLRRTVKIVIFKGGGGKERFGHLERTGTQNLSPDPYQPPVLPLDPFHPLFESCMKLRGDY